MTEAAQGGAVGGPPSAAERAFAAVDALNEAVGRVLGPVIVLVTLAIVYEIVMRSVFLRATLWASEAVVYGSAAVYLLAGGYALRHGRHVRIDGFVGMLPRGLQRLLPALRLLCVLLSAATHVWVGGKMAWSSFAGAEGTGTPWNPPIWPVKACIPLAGLLLALQAIADTAREMGLVRPAEPAR